MNETVPVLGTSLVYGTAGGTPATPLANVAAFRGLPKLTSDEYDISRIDQTSFVKVFAPGMADQGTLQPTLGFQKAQIVILYGLYRVTKSWEVLFFDGSKLVGDGWIKVLGKQVPGLNNEIKVDVDIRCIGQWVFTAAP